MSEPYYCTKCGREHLRGKIYEAHKAYAGREPSDMELSRTVFQGTGPGPRHGLLNKTGPSPDDLAPYAIPPEAYPTTVNPTRPGGVGTWATASEGYVDFDTDEPAFKEVRVITVPPTPRKVSWWKRVFRRGGR